MARPNEEPEATPTSHVASATAEQLAIHVGWTMALLYQRALALPDDPAQATAVQGALVTASYDSYDPEQYTDLEIRRLHHLLKRLSTYPAFDGIDLPDDVSAVKPATEGQLNKEQLNELNIELLGAFSAAGAGIETAYHLGHSLRNTVSPPVDTNDRQSVRPTDQLARQLSRSRISYIQQLLAILAPQVPDHAAAIVSASIGRWHEVGSVTLTQFPLRKGVRQDDLARQLALYLRPQGNLWLLLLVVHQSTTGLRASANVVRRVLQRYMRVFVSVAVLLGAALYLIVTNTSGATSVVITIAAVVGSLGISAKGIVSVLGTLFAKDTQQPILRHGVEDAMSEVITIIPPIFLTHRQERRLRRAGVRGLWTYLSGPV